MTVINTNYATIEEAWGVPIKKQKQKLSAASDPLCDLYNKRNDRTKRPYAIEGPVPNDGMTLAPYRKAQTGRTLNSGVVKGGDYRENARPSRVPSYRPVMVNTSEDVYDARNSFEDADDAYFERALREEIPERQGARLIAYDSGNSIHGSRFRHIDDDNISEISSSSAPIHSLNQNQNQNSIPIHTESFEHFDKEHESFADRGLNGDYDMYQSRGLGSGIEKDYDTNTTTNTNTNTNTNNNNTNTNTNTNTNPSTRSIEKEHDKLLDFGLYIISGVLMIFTMEQILQLGMKMRD
jgi:hypothetical protein